VRPGTVVVISLLAAAAGAAGVIAAGGGRFGHVTQTVVLRDPLGGAGMRSVVISKPVVARNFHPETIYRQRAPGVVTVFSHFDDGTTEEGSGFVVSSAGYVLTAAHVITSTSGDTIAGPASDVYLEFGDGDRVKAKILGWDPFDDVGLLHVDPDAHRLTVVPIGSSASVQVGAPVATIGSPFGNIDSLAVGVVSATHRAIPSLTAGYDLIDAIQTDAPINEGDSGAPLLDARGRAIGIDAQIRSSGGGGFEGVAFAVPIDLALRSLTQLLARGHVTYAYAGLTTEDLTPTIARRYGYGALHGALVDSVAAGGPAAKAGVRPGTRDVRVADQEVTIGGDAIVAIDGLPVADSDDVARIVSERLLPGEVADFTIVRGTRRLEVPIKLGNRQI
jgi:S1-C subfamily serine protease